MKSFKLILIITMVALMSQIGSAVDISIIDTSVQSDTYYYKDGENTAISFYMKDGEDKIVLSYEDFLNESNKFGWVFDEQNVKDNFTNLERVFDKNIYLELTSDKEYTRSSTNPYLLWRYVYDEIPIYNYTCIEFGEVDDIWGTTCTNVEKTLSHYIFQIKTEMVENQIGILEERFVKNYIDFQEPFTKPINLYEYETTEELVCVSYNESDLSCLKQGLRNITRKVKRNISFDMYESKGNWVMEFFNLFDLDPTINVSSDTSWNDGQFTNMITEGSGVNANLTSNLTDFSYSCPILDSLDTNANWTNISWSVEYPYQEEMPSNGVDEAWGNMTGNVLLMHFNNDSNLGENDTHVVDLSGNGNDGTVFGGNITTPDGKFNRAMQFDGNSDYINISDDPSLDFGTNDFTLISWIKTSDRGVIINKYDSSVIGFNLQIAANVQIVISDDGSNFDVAGVVNTNVIDNFWHQVVGVKTSSGIFLYIDGILRASDTSLVTTGSISGNKELLIGDRTDIADFFNGTIDEVAIFNRSLTQAEITSNYNRGAVRYNLSVRSCDDALCDGETFTQLEQNATFGRQITNLSDSIPNNRYWQCQINGTNETTATFRMNSIFTDFEDFNPPVLNFTSPTLANGATNISDTVIINTSITEPTLGEVIWNWNGTNFTIYDNDLVGRWNFDNVSSLGENDTHVVDLSGNGNDGLASGVIVTSDSIYNGAFNFTGVDADMIVIEDDTIFDFPNDYSHSVWIFPEGSGDSLSPILSKFDETGQQRSYTVYLDRGDSNKIKCAGSPSGSGAGFNRADSNPITTNEWHYITCQYDNSANNITVYVDGVFHAEAAVTGIFSGNADLYIGRSQTTFGGASIMHFNGTIDEISMWNRTLSPEEINQQFMSNLNKYDTDKWSLLVNQSQTPTTTLEDGNYTYFTAASDTRGNENMTEVRSVFIGEIAPPPEFPDIFIDSPTNTTINNNFYDLKVSSTGTINTWWYSNDSGITNNTFTPNITFLNVVDGSYEVIVWNNDSDGDENTTSVSFRIDTVPCKSFNFYNESSIINLLFKINCDGKMGNVPNPTHTLNIDGDSNFTGKMLVEDDVEIKGYLNQTEGNATINMIYAEMWNYSSTGDLKLVNLVTAGVYHNVSNLTVGNINGFDFINDIPSEGGSKLVAQVPGLYKADFQISFVGVASGGTYGISISHDADPNMHRECYTRRVGSGAVGSASITCLMDFDVGQFMNVQIEDEGDPVKDINIHTLNLNLVRIGDA